MNDGEIKEDAAMARVEDSAAVQYEALLTAKTKEIVNYINTCAGTRVISEDDRNVRRTLLSLILDVKKGD